MIGFKAVYRNTDQDFRIGWRIQCQSDPCASWGLSDRDIVFARKRDCERAIQLLVAAGIDSDEKIEDLDNEALSRIICEGMAW
jgi:hypothetical protein